MMVVVMLTTLHIIVVENMAVMNVSTVVIAMDNDWFVVPHDVTLHNTMNPRRMTSVPGLTLWTVQNER